MRYILENINYAAPYPGTLFASLFKLEEMLESQRIKLIYLLPPNAAELDWVKDIINMGKIVYFKDNIIDVVLANIYDKYNYHIIHTHFLDIKECIKINNFRKNYKNISVILHHHNHFMHCNNENSNILRNTIKKLLRRPIQYLINPDINIACSYDVAKSLQKQKMKNVICVENAIDFSRLDEYDKNAVNKDVSKFNILMFGFDFYRKGVDLAVKAINEISGQYDIKLHIVFSINANENLERIKNMLGYLPEWISPLYPREDIAAYYNIADCFISPSREEGFCYAIVEASYCGCKIIFSDISGQSHAKNIPFAKSFTANDYSSLKEQIVSMIENNIECDKKFIRDYVVKRYSLDNWCKGIIESYNKCDI